MLQLAVNGAVVTVIDTWALFEVKMAQSSVDYRWLKIDVLTRWLAFTKQTTILLFDIQEAILEQLLESIDNTDTSYLDDPFWIYAALLQAVVCLQDAAVWAVRDQVRAVERDRSPTDQPQPAYRRLHDMARHAIHSTETLDVTKETVGHILAHYKDFLRTDLGRSAGGAAGLHACLQYSETVLGSLRHRSIANEKRLQNEIQLAFNTVAQYDAGISREIGRATQVDSRSMRTIAVVTLVFLPPTFISALFGMSFFDYAAGGDWLMSDKFWVYWVCAIPITLLVVGIWHCWDQVSTFPLRHRVGVTKRLW